MNEQNEPKRAGDILGGMNLEAKFEALIAEAPEERPEEPAPEPKPRILNDSFFPRYRKPWEETPKGDFPAQLAKARGIVDSGAIGILIGTYGAGKTRLLAETARATYWRGARYMTTDDFFSKIRSTYSRNSHKTEEEIKDELVRIPLLCLDEIDKRSETKNENALLFSIVNRRFEFERPTLIAGNVNPKELIRYFDEAILDRVKVGGGLIIFEGESFRERRRP